MSLTEFVVVAELSDVLWNMVLLYGFKFTGVPGVVACFVLFTYWAGESLVLPSFLLNLYHASLTGTRLQKLSPWGQSKYSLYADGLWARHAILGG